LQIAAFIIGWNADGSSPSKWLPFAATAHFWRMALPRPPVFRQER